MLEAAFSPNQNICTMLITFLWTIKIKICRRINEKWASHIIITISNLSEQRILKSDKAQTQASSCLGTVIEKPAEKYWALPTGQACSECLPYLIFKQWDEIGSIISPFYRWKNQGTKRLGQWPKTPPLGILTPEPMLEPLLHILLMKAIFPH